MLRASPRRAATGGCAATFRPASGSGNPGCLTGSSPRRSALGWVARRGSPECVVVMTSPSPPATSAGDALRYNVNQMLSFVSQLFLWMVHATVGICAAGCGAGAGRSPRVAWTIGAWHGNRQMVGERLTGQHWIGSGYATRPGCGAMTAGRDAVIPGRGAARARRGAADRLNSATAAAAESAMNTQRPVTAHRGAMKADCGTVSV